MLRKYTGRTAGCRLLLASAPSDPIGTPHAWVDKSREQSASDEKRQAADVDTIGVRTAPDVTQMRYFTYRTNVRVGSCEQ